VPVDCKTPFTNHETSGSEPPFVTVAVKVVNAPSLLQIGLLAALILILGTTAGLTFIMNGDEKTKVGEAQVALLVSLTLTWSLPTKAVVVKVEEVAPPTLAPLICH
jgi:hypothetical protein